MKLIGIPGDEDGQLPLASFLTKEKGPTQTKAAKSELRRQHYPNIPTGSGVQDGDSPRVDLGCCASIIRHVAKLRSIPRQYLTAIGYIVGSRQELEKVFTAWLKIASFRIFGIVF